MDTSIEILEEIAPNNKESHSNKTSLNNKNQNESIELIYESSASTSTSSNQVSFNNLVIRNFGIFFVFLIISFNKMNLLINFLKIKLSY